jgi:tetratricopeptide (TPR) repeat protein
VTNWTFKPSLLLALSTCAIGCQSDPKPSARTYQPLEFLQHTQASVEEALRIEPKVAKAADPTRLDYNAGPIKPNLHLSAAAVMEQNGQLDTALEHYQQVLAMESSNRAALIGVARLHHRAGSMDEAIAAYQNAAQVVGNDPVILNDLALCLTRTNRHAEAIESLRAALVLKPDSLLYRNNLAAVLVESKRVDEAVQVLTETHGLAVAHYNVGYLLNRHGEPAAASAHFVQSLRADPSFQPAKTMLDRVLPEVGQRREQRIADRAPPSASAAVRPTQPGGASVPPPSTEPPHDLPPQTAIAPASLLTSDALPGEVRPTEFAPAHSLETAPQVDVATAPRIDVPQVPPIRLPVPVSARRVSEGPGGFIAPAPTAK